VSQRNRLVLLQHLADAPEMWIWRRRRGEGENERESRLKVRGGGGERRGDMMGGR